MKIRSVGALADKRTDGQTDTKKILGDFRDLRYCA